MTFEDFVKLFNTGENVRYDFEIRFELIKNIVKKISLKSNNSYLEIWLQRLVVKNLCSDSEFVTDYVNNSNEKLVKLCNDIIRTEKTELVIFNEDWIKKEYKIKWNNFINKEEVEKLSDIISSEEIKFLEY